MKILILLALVPFSALATPALNEGEWAYSHIQALQEKTIERIDPRFASGQERLQELRKAGIACVYKLANLVECSWFEKNPQLTVDLSEQLKKSFSLTKLLVHPLESSDLTNEGDYLKEYLINQKVDWNGNSYSSYRWLKTPDFQKAVIGDDYFNIYNDSIALSLVLNRDLGRWNAKMYLVEIHFNQK